MWKLSLEAGAIVLRAVRAGDRCAFTHPGMRDDVDTAFESVRTAMTAYV